MDNIVMQSASNKLGNQRDSYGCVCLVKRNGILFDGKVVLMLVLPIHFVNLKAADVMTVSKL